MPDTLPELLKTEQHRRHVAETAKRLPKSKVWPNGLGLDWHGWELLYHPATPNLLEHWTACDKRSNRVRYGEGSTPEEAWAAAKIARGGE